MAAETEFDIGATVSCSDGVCGEVRRMIVDPATDTVTHLVVEPKHHRGAGRLVPTHLADTTAGGIRLHCTMAEFDGFDHAEERDLAEDMPGAGAGGLVGDAMAYGVGGEVYMAGIGGAMGVTEGMQAPPPAHRRTIVQDVVPLGETQVRPGDRVHAVDGEIGRVRGFLVSPGDDRVTHVLLEEGHLWGHKEVAIPVSAVTGVKLGIRLNITKQEVEHLPPVG
jgi:sporulation protein YlmC with PRC-barrel domain